MSEVSDGIDTAAQGLQIRIRFVVKVSFITQTEKRKALKTLISFLQSEISRYFRGKTTCWFIAREKIKGEIFAFGISCIIVSPLWSSFCYSHAAWKHHFWWKRSILCWPSKSFTATQKSTKASQRKENTKENHPKIFFGYFRGKTLCIYSPLLICITRAKISSSLTRAAFSEANKQRWTNPFMQSPQLLAWRFNYIFI